MRIWFAGGLKGEFSVVGTVSGAKRLGRTNGHRCRAGHDATTFAYDPGGRLQSVTAPDPDAGGPQQPSTMDYTYDALGNVLASTDSLGDSSSTVYDARWRPVVSTDQGDNDTLYQYDVFGNLLSVLDARQNQTDFVYDRWDRSYVETKGTHSRTMLLDPLGHVRHTTDRNGREMELEYDPFYRLTREVWLDGSDEEIREFVYTYDEVGNLLTVADNHIDPSTGTRTPASESMELVYDDRDQLQLERMVSPLVGVSTVLERDYDLRGLRTSVAANLGGTIQGSSVSGGIADYANQYAYDALGRLTSVSQDAQVGGNAVADKLATFTFDAASQLNDLRRYSSVAVDPLLLEVHSRYGYDGAGRLQSITHAQSEIAPGETWTGTATLAPSLQGGALLAGYVLGYDQDNRLTEWSSYYDAFQTTYTYDSRDQLTGATHAVISGLTPPLTLPGAESYSFDETGNRNLSGGGSSSAPGSHNQVQSDGTYTYEYDQEGNQIRRTSIATGAVTEYAWDYRNRLVEVTERGTAVGPATSVVTYQYDAFDRRTGKEVDSDADGTADRAEAWVWQGDQVALQLVDADGDGAGTWKLANRYLYGDVVDQVLANEQLPGGGISLTSVSGTPGTVLWPLADHLGSVRDLVDSSGVIREHVVYDSFGNRLSESDFDASGNPIASNHPAAVDHLFGYTGREWDDDAQLQYNRARWYDPAQGRWLSEDPIGFAAGDTNLYRYVGNQPTTKTDPSGLDDVYGTSDTPEDLENWIRNNPDHPYRWAAEQTLKNMRNPVRLPPTPNFGDQFTWGDFEDYKYQNWFERRYPGWINEAKRRADSILATQAFQYQMTGECQTIQNPIARVIPDRDKENSITDVFFPPFQGDGVDQGETAYGDSPQWAREANADGPGGFWFDLENVRIQRVGGRMYWIADLVIRDALGVSPQDRNESGVASASLTVDAAILLGAHQDRIVSHAKFCVTGSAPILTSRDKLEILARQGGRVQPRAFSPHGHPSRR